MIKVKDGYGKLIGSSYNGDISLILLSNGGNIGYDIFSTTLTIVLRNSDGLIESSLTDKAPFKVASTTLVENLNADLLDGYQWDSFYIKGINNVYNHGKSIGSLTAVNSDANAWNNSLNVNLKLVSSNNAMVLSVSDIQNERHAMIQVGHNTTNYAANTGVLYLNPLGGSVYIGTTKAATIDSNVASATKLQTARTIWGQSFDGTADISGDMTGVGNITITSGGNVDRFITFDTTSTRSWRIGYLGTGSGDANYLAFQSTKTLTAADGWHDMLKIGCETGNAIFTGLLIAGGYIKSGYDDTYVLLAGGGHKALSEFGGASGDYVLKTGDTMTGNLILYASSGDSPHLIFQRATTTDTKLDWDQYVTDGSFKIRVNNGTWTEALSLYPNSISTAWNITANDFTASSGIYRSATTLYLDSASTTTSIIFRQGTTERMRIALPDGNVGIGTTTPGEKLHVIGNVSVSDKIYLRRAYDNVYLYFLGTLSGNTLDENCTFLISNTSGAGGIRFDTYGDSSNISHPLYLHKGKVKIGTWAVPNYTLDVAGNAFIDSGTTRPALSIKSSFSLDTTNNMLSIFFIDKDGVDVGHIDVIGPDNYNSSNGIYGISMFNYRAYRNSSTGITTIGISNNNIPYVACGGSGTPYYEILHGGNYSAAWNATFNLNTWSRILGINDYASVLVSITFGGTNEATLHTYLVSTGYNSARIVLLGSNGYSNYYNALLRVTYTSATLYYLEIYHTYNYSGSPDTCHCRFTKLSKSGVVTPITTITAGGGTVANSLTSHNQIAANFYASRASTADSLISHDTRSNTINPNSYSAGFRAHFLRNSTNGVNDGGEYYGLINFKPYGSTADFSGGYPHLLAFTENSNIWYRKATSSTAWGSWVRLLTSGNYTSYTDGRYYRAYIGGISSSTIDTFDSGRVCGGYSISYSGYSGMLLSFKSGLGSVSSIEIMAPHYDFGAYGLKARLAVDNNRYTAWRTFVFTDSTTFIKRSGDTLSSNTARISRAGSSVSWYLGRTNAMIYISSYTGYNAIASMKTTNGDWSIGVYSDNKMYFTYFTDTNANGAVNSHSGQVYLSPGGYVYAAHFYEHSDIKLKTNIETITSSDNIPQLKSFDWKSDGKHSYGLIAQELEEQGYSELVDNSGEHKTVNYSAALSLIVGKLQVKIKELEKEIETLKNKN